VKRKIVIATGLVLACLILYLGITGNRYQEEGSDDDGSSQAIDTVSQATEERYQELEIRDYEGIRLDPSIGPRDNSIAGIQQINIEEYKLQITGLVKNPLSLSYEQVLENKSYERLITLYCVEGWDATVLWKGVRIIDLLNEAETLNEKSNVIFHCVDGYTTSMPLETIKTRDLLLAYSSNGVTLPESLGFPFIVVAEDKAGYKWARWVNKIEISDDLTYEGYWESRGYSNEADIRR
jgi:DMSO/TMAO reductase YedYZ molybdopterin-dependent catalytic subunit